MNTCWAMLDRFPRRVLLLVSLACFCMLAFGLYLQHSLGLEPCPMCIVQRYAFILVALLALLGGLVGSARTRGGLLLVTLVAAVFGAFVAARQSWLQWFPPEVYACGRDFYGMIENFPLKRAIPMIFRGSGDCSVVDWAFLGLSIANWSFLVFVGLAGLALLMLWRRQR